MIRRRLFALAFGALAAGMAATAAAAEIRPFDAKTFAAAQAQGRPILVDVHADWCPTCKAQTPIIGSIIKAPEYDRLVVFKLNFDKQKADWKRLNVQRQSTLIAFRGPIETGRSVADTRPEGIAVVIRSALR